MDIELEKSRHEEWYKEKFPFLYKIYSNRMCRDEHEIAFANSETTWLAAKAQAVPEGFVLVPVIDIELALLEQFGPVHPAVLESQEQSHDGK